MKTAMLSATLVLSLISSIAGAAPSLGQAEIARALRNRSTAPNSRAYLVMGVAADQIHIGAPNKRGVARWTVKAEKLAAPNAHVIEPVLLTGTFRQGPPQLGNPAGSVRIRVTSVMPAAHR
jgi:hypothetical protein